MTTQLDLDFCSDYLKVHSALKRKAHHVSLIIGDDRWRARSHAECLRFGSYEGLLLYYYVDLVATA